MAEQCCSGMNVCSGKMKTVLLHVFSSYGQFVGSHPVPFIVMPIVVFGGLGLGILKMETETDSNKLFLPENSRIRSEHEIVQQVFPWANPYIYSLFSLTYMPAMITVLFESRDTDNIFSDKSIAEVRNVVNLIKSLDLYRSSCAVRYTECIVYGEYVLNQTFLTALAAGEVFYRAPWNVSGELKDLRDVISLVTEDANGKFLVSAKLLKIEFHLLYWNSSFDSLISPYIENLKLKHVEMYYELTNSVDTELEKDVMGELYLFPVTILLCCTYASVVTIGGNPVSTRGLLACAGIVAAGLSIIGSIGLLCLCGVKYVQLVSAMPFLITGIGIDDMFIVMSSWSETLGDVGMSVPRRLGVTLATAGAGITITSLTDCLAFGVGSVSDLLSVKNFSIYTCVAVLFCYLANITLFSGCLAIHGRRVYASRHFLTCRVTKPRQDLLDEGQNPCIARCCGGSPPDHSRADENCCERFPGLLLPIIFRWKPVSVLIILCFSGYLGAAVYGALHIKRGLPMHNLVKDTSYVYRTLLLEEQYFPKKDPVSFIVNKRVDYTSEGLKLLDLMQQARKDPDVMPDFERCWLSSYRHSPFYNESAPQDFIRNLLSFLHNNIEFLTDVNFDREEVIASRCFVLAKPTSDQYVSAKLMERMQKLTDAFPLPAFAFYPTYLMLEEILGLLPTTMKMIGFSALVITVVTFLFLPNIFIVFLVVLTSAMITTGVFGFMYYWDIYLSTSTMIELVMSIGFSVDFSAHVCAAYLLSSSRSREQRTEDAIRHAAGPVLNGALSTLMGVLVLATADSYILVSFFEVMLLVMVLGLLHAAFFLPAVLSLIGPLNRDDSSVPVRGTDA